MYGEIPCVETENSIYMPGIFARYNQRRDYEVLDEKFEDIYRLILDDQNYFLNHISPPDLPMSSDESSPVLSRTPDVSPPRIGVPRTPDGTPPRIVVPITSDETPPMTPDSPRISVDSSIDVDIPLITIGMFLITVDNNTISFKKAEWDDFRDKPNRESIDIDCFERLMENGDFREYMQLYITKIVQDKFVSHNVSGELIDQEFYVFIDFYYNRYRTNYDMFHQDDDHLIDIDYFTLTYLLPKDRVILGASLLVQSDTEMGKKGGLKEGEYAALSIAIKNLTTLGFTNKDRIFHSTPAPISSRQFLSGETEDFMSSELHQCRKGKVEEYIHNPDTFGFERKTTIDIDLVPLKMETLPYSAMGPVSKVINDTIETHRSFLRCCFANVTSADKYSQDYSFNVVLDELRGEILSVEVITLNTYFEHVLGGKKTGKKVGKKTRRGVIGGKKRGKKSGKKVVKTRKTTTTQLKKRLYNPNINIILKT